jgi:uncharacterized protein (DUF1015 family)
MSEIKPFKAFFYNSEKIDNLSKVVAPPYDVISADEQTVLQNQSPYNFTHIDLAKDKPGDDKDNNKYTRAKKIYDEWIKKGILVQDDRPSIYFYKQEYTIQGEKYTRTGFIALMELHNDQEARVYPHENTHAHAIEDRLSLCQQLNSHLSCIFVCYSDQQKKVEKVFLNKVLTSKPFMDVTDNDQVRHKLWRLSDEKLINEIQGALSSQNVFIADGHHRFKVSVEYHRLISEQKGTTKGPHNYVMTYFTNIDSKDLKILPMHRIVTNFPKSFEFLQEYFRMDKIKKREDLVILLAQAGRNEHAFGLYTKNEVLLLRLKNKLLIDKFITEGSADYKSLDASILKFLVFDKIGIKSTDIIYTKDINQCFDMVNNDQAAASFIMNPVKISQMKAIALNGEKMPPKTTYFYPKVLSGLTVYKMD